MAKSLRSKTKRAFRSKKRETGVYAAAAAARLNRLNAKLIQTTKKDLDGDVIVGDAQEGDTSGWCWFATFGLMDPNDITLDGLEAETLDDIQQVRPDSMAIDTEYPKRVSTHGPRGSRREEWRKSKGRDCSTEKSRALQEKTLIFNFYTRDPSIGLTA
ncbi:unnamed protein product [Cyclocybe aegerita]|uniref:DUF2423 domain-containing protein n=1 Tax=Cyclocybe aegerita TaxID=1973307 RepID=A0A8S0VTF2_CYCAE|nr:unnamed protein product [Cyclocybe aegerita]